ncbi:MAG: ATP-binding protein [Acidobacteria bacterium]|nr:ATP-binding protein [Acidobacteriota bacterium]
MKLTLNLPAVPEVELVAAKAVELVGRDLGLSSTCIESVTVATVEACLNAIEHGNQRGFAVRIETQAAGGERWLVIEVEDHGGGFDPEAVSAPSGNRKHGSAPNRGWGLKLIRDLMDDVDVQSRPGLTIVRMKRRIGGT